MFKSQLQEYAQKTGLPAPVYHVTKEGPSHEPQFKASVSIHGKVYESPQFFGNLRKAEHAAAELALAAVGKAETGQLHESGLCKNLLQEYAQKCKLPLPVYSVEKTGEVHLPTFCATVEIAGVQYNGGNCKTKKEAEVKAAKMALVAIYADSGPPKDTGPLDGVEDPTVDEENPASAVVEATPEPKPGKKRRKLVKVGSDARKQKVKVEQIGNSGIIVDALDQAIGSASKGSGAQVSKQEGSPTSFCTTAAAKVGARPNGSAQEQQA